MSTHTGLPEDVVREFDFDMFEFIDRYCGQLDRLRRKHNLTDENIAALLRERFGDMDDVWFEFAQESRPDERVQP